MSFEVQPDQTQDFLVTRAEALKLVLKSRRERAQWALSVRLDARIEGKPDSYFQDALAHWINLTRRQASQLIKNLMGDTLEGRGARIRIQRRTPAPCGSYQGPSTYWITQ